MLPRPIPALEAAAAQDLAAREGVARGPRPAGSLHGTRAGPLPKPVPTPVPRPVAPPVPARGVADRAGPRGDVHVGRLPRVQDRSGRRDLGAHAVVRDRAPLDPAQRPQSASAVGLGGASIER